MTLLPRPLPAHQPINDLALADVLGARPLFDGLPRLGLHPNGKRHSSLIRGHGRASTLGHGTRLLANCRLANMSCIKSDGDRMVAMMTTTRTATLGPIGSRDHQHGTRVDGSSVAFFGSNSRAITAAKACGWPVNSVVRAHTRFQTGYALAYSLKEQGIGGLMAKSEYERLAKPAGVTP